MVCCLLVGGGLLKGKLFAPATNDDDREVQEADVRRTVMKLEQTVVG
jgi:hypothetical protein